MLAFESTSWPSKGGLTTQLALGQPPCYTHTSVTAAEDLAASSTATACT